MIYNQTPRFQYVMLKLDHGAIMKFQWAQGPAVMDNDLDQSVCETHIEKGTCPGHFELESTAVPTLFLLIVTPGSIDVLTPMFADLF